MLKVEVERRAAKSKRIVIGKNQPGRSPQNLEVEAQRPIFDIIKVVIDAMDDFINTIQCATITINLRPPGDSGLDTMA